MKLPQNIMEELSQAEQQERFEKDEKIRKLSIGEWPKYAMAFWNLSAQKKDKQRKLFSFKDAARLFDSGFFQVKFGIYVLYEDMTMRRMTEFDQHKISEAADEYSASK